MSILSHSESTWKTLVLKHEARILQLVAENSKLTTALEEMTQRGLRQAEHRIVADQRAEVAERETAALREEHETLKERNRALLAEPSEPFLIACLQGDQEALQQAIAALRQERDDWRQAFETANEAIGKMESAHAHALREAFAHGMQAYRYDGAWEWSTIRWSDTSIDDAFAAYLASRDGGTI